MSNPIINQNPNSHHPSKMSLAKRIVIIASTILGFILLLILFALGSKSTNSQNEPSTETGQKPASNSRTEDGEVPKLIAENMDKTTDITPKDEANDVPDKPPLNSPPIVTTPKLTLAMQRSMAYEQQMLDYRQQQQMTAMASDTNVQFKSPNTSNAQSSNNALSQLNEQAKLLQERLNQQSSLPQDINTGEYASPSVNAQQQKNAFMKEARGVDYLKYDKAEPISPFELKVGTVIPATLISGINSDLPGEVIASVSQNVYDSTTGNYLLIPQGSKLYGVYDSQISYGQSRVLLAWSRINFPNGSTLNLDNMNAMDTQGYSGFEDEVDNHYFKTFGNALLLGLISGASQAGVSKNDNRNPPSAIADGVTQQFAQTGSNLIQKNLDTQPTIVIRNGYRFNVMVNKDVLLTPYAP